MAVLIKKTAQRLIYFTYIHDANDDNNDNDKATLLLLLALRAMIEYNNKYYLGMGKWKIRQVNF